MLGEKVHGFGTPTICFPDSMTQVIKWSTLHVNYSKNMEIMERMPFKARKAEGMIESA